MSAALPARMIADLIGKPYRDGARGPAEYDCEGLFVEVQRRRGYALDVPALGTQVQRTRAWLRIVDRTWTRLDSPRPGCAVFFAGDLHVGTMYDRLRFLHTTSEMGSAFVDRLDSPHWRAKMPLFYDWAAIAKNDGDCNKPGGYVQNLKNGGRA